MSAHTRPETGADIDAPSADELRRRVKQLCNEHQRTLARMPGRIQIHMQWEINTRDTRLWGAFEKNYPPRIALAAAFDTDSPRARAEHAETLDRLQREMRDHAALLATE
jgi:hypothetical protein